MQCFYLEFGREVVLLLGDRLFRQWHVIHWGGGLDKAHYSEQNKLQFGRLQLSLE